MGKITKRGEQALATIHRKEKPKTKLVKRVNRRDIEKLLEKYSIDYLNSKRELQEINIISSAINEYMDLKLKKKTKELEAKKQQIDELFDG